MAKGLVVTGISGGGKTTIAKELSIRYPQLFQPLRITIREPRPDEIDGIDYEFLSKDELLELNRKNELLFCKEWYGSIYAMRSEPVESRINNNEDVLIETIVPAAFELFKRNDMKVVFLVTPDKETEIQRLRNRGEKEEKIVERVGYACKEIEMAKKLKVKTIINDDLARALDEVEKFLFN